MLRPNVRSIPRRAPEQAGGKPCASCRARSALAGFEAPAHHGVAANALVQRSDLHGAAQRIG
jgi:hypothetical protein